MIFSKNQLSRKDRTSSFLSYGEAGKFQLKFQANFSEVFEVLSSNDGPKFPTFHYSDARGLAAER